MAEIELNSGLTAGLAVPDEQAPVKAADPHYRQQVKDAAVKFEGMFIAQMLHEMRKSTREISADDSIFKDRLNSDMLDFADTQVADAMASQRAFGIADVIVKQLLPEKTG